MIGVRYTADALEDLRAIGDSSVIAEILALALKELRRPPAESAIEGIVYEGPAPLWRRRAVPLADLRTYESFDLDDDIDEFRCQACDYLLMYRDMTSDERIVNHVAGEALYVVHVYAIVDLRRHLNVVLGVR